MHKLIAEKVSCVEELAQATTELSQPSMSSAKRVSHLKRRLWLLTGVLERGFEMRRLEQIVALHERIGSVPQDYF